MFESEYIKYMQSSYERIHLKERPDEQRYQYCILTRGGIRRLLSCSLRYINGEAYLYYDITSKQNVGQHYAKQAITREWVKDFFWSYEQATQEMGRFLLDEKNILVYPDQIFEDLSSHRFFFLYLPYNEEGTGMKNLLEFIMEHMDYNDTELVECVYYIYEQYEKYGDVYLQEQIFADVSMLDEGKTVETDPILPEDNMVQEDSIEQAEAERYQLRNDSPEELRTTKTEEEGKRGFFSRMGLKRKSKEEQKNRYRNAILAKMEGRSVAEEDDYTGLEDFEDETDEGEYSKTIYIEQKPEEEMVRRLYTPDGRVVIKFLQDVCVIGKYKEEADLVLEDSTISRLHARISKEGDRMYLEDLNSTNGTFKNGLRMQPYEKRRLEEGDEVRFGKLLFIFR